eukprot:8226121-Pyramimonas_sp.AAC.1
MAAAARERIRRQLLSARSTQEPSRANTSSDSKGHCRDGEVREPAVSGRDKEPLREHTSGTSPLHADDVQGGDQPVHARR